MNLSAPIPPVSLPDPGRAARAISLLCAAALLLTASFGARAEDQLIQAAPHGAAWASLPPPRGSDHFPLVLILSDRSGADGRQKPYVDSLLRAGIAVIEFGVDHVDPGAPTLTLAGLRDIAPDMAPGRLDPSRIGVLGFGWGGRVALAIRENIPVAALYPACTGFLTPPRTAPTLLLHPDDAAEAVACRRIASRAEPILGATHGWDHGQGLWENGTMMMPHPNGTPARIFSRSDVQATQEAAARVLKYFEGALRGVQMIGGDGG